MSKQIFPKEIIENSVEAHFFKNRNSSKIIYSILILSLLILFLALPFIFVKVNHTSQGIIRPELERTVFLSSHNGFVEFSALRNNTNIKKGDTLLMLKNNAVTKNIEKVGHQIKEQNNFIHDLTHLVQSRPHKDSLKSLKFILEFNLYNQKLRELLASFTKSKINYYRNLELFKKGVIAKTTLEDFKLAFDLSKNAISQHKNQKVSHWESLLFESQLQLNELINSQNQLEETKNLSVMIAPINGTLLEVTPIQINSFIQNGQKLAIISPDSKLVIESYISPNDIGFINNGDLVKYQVSAFNYNQWGLAQGSIYEISKDIQLVNNNPMFKVLSTLDESYLSLKNGYKGTLIKGMLVNVRYELTERSVFNLLYDKMDDWLNPATELNQN
ncbi:MAG: HlyD family efflux transporter periplasmic adaptor subunit [Flavobacteriaceae bacterium]|nr:HlyD family efflux transporter periplasmic adaptor subunit [Flavobacteriaceae bacterium]MCI5088633.1 HlyD family efflux transporter periplasmic adaptor subunit [Flavobacteriaceae bacterium]